MAIVLAFACALALAPGAQRASVASHRGPPHVILITTDDQTVRDMIALPKTQALLGAAGATFTNAYASYPLCCPARATLLTGQHAHNHGVLGNLPPEGGYSALRDEQTIPVWLRSRKYRSIHIGKMPNGFGTTDQTYVPPGWKPFPADGEFYGFLPDPPSAYTGFKLNENGVPVTYGESDYQTDIYGQIAVQRIGAHFSIAPNRPLYMQVHFFAPHDPATPAPRHAGAFATAQLPVDKAFNERDIRDKPPWLRAVKRMGPGLRGKVLRRYRTRLESLLSVDDAVERIVGELEAQGVLDETYVIFTSDNGYMQGQQRLHQGKFVAYDPSSKVPLLIRGPGVPAGVTTKELVSNVDVVPTLLDAAGAAPGITQDGRSMLPFARKPSLRSTRPVLLETGQPIGISDPASASGGARAKSSIRVKNLDLDGTAQFAKVVKPPKYRAIRTGRYLLVKYSDGGRELYDMSKDPLQLDSLWKDPRYAPVRKWLLKKLAKLAQCAGETCNRELHKPPKPLPRPKRKPGDAKQPQPD
ncbi:MAG: sulfatase [Solirubrobacterales bacterium]|jgi:arylsulfatase A-like enzyme|nr:sulfatase [Solirubrobacterales bacterium]